MLFEIVRSISYLYPLWSRFPCIFVFGLRILVLEFIQNTPDASIHCLSYHMQDGGKEVDLPQNTQDLTIFVQNLLQQMQGRFEQMSDTILGRIDEMGTRIDDLEKSIGDLMQQAGVEEKDLQ